MAGDQTFRSDFFRELFQLDTIEESSEDFENVLADFRARKPSCRLSHSSGASSGFGRVQLSRQIQSPERNVSAPLLFASTVSSAKKEPSHLKKGPRSKKTATSLSVSSKADLSATPARPNLPSGVAKGSVQMPPAGKKKRKRSQSLELLPNAQRIFQDLRFYFIPNNDISPARKLRIRKARERGATWVKEWNDDVTHVIVDKGLTLEDILKFLKKPSLPSEIVVVNDLYPAECIEYRILANPNQRQYQLKGEPQKPTKAPEEATTSSPPPSLALVAKKRAVTHRQQSPPRAELSEQDSDDPPSDIDDDVPSPSNRPVESLKSQTRAPDALDKAIEETVAVKDLVSHSETDGKARCIDLLKPLDDEDDASPISSIDVEEPFTDDNEEEIPTAKKLKGTSAKKKSYESFSCMQSHTSTDTTSNPNARTISILQQMADYYDRTQDRWRVIAYRRAISALKHQPTKITTKAAALAIPTIGDRLASKIEEIALTNRLRRLENTSSSPTDTALQLFLSIYGVGPAQAQGWIEAGYRTLDDLLAKANLTTNQKIGIHHNSDFAARIPRAEVERHGKVVRDAMSKEDPGIEITIGGSYRRGAADSGDVDFIVTKPGASFQTLRTIIYDTVVPRLFAMNYLKCALATPSPSSSSSSNDNGSKWHGAATLPGMTVWRRIDFLLVPPEEMGAALIYFT
ncbi:MAG: hypothetical protein Q9222_007526, partial [Ikaeria aurantiellina]